MINLPINFEYQDGPTDNEDFRTICEYIMDAINADGVICFIKTPDSIEISCAIEKEDMSIFIESLTKTLEVMKKDYEEMKANEH